MNINDSLYGLQNESVTSVNFGSSAGALNATELSASGGGGLCLPNPHRGSAPVPLLGTHMYDRAPALAMTGARAPPPNIISWPRPVRWYVCSVHCSQDGQATRNRRTCRSRVAWACSIVFIPNVFRKIPPAKKRMSPKNIGMQLSECLHYCAAVL